MVKQIVNKLNSINDFSKKIIIYIYIISLSMCVAGISVILYNSFSESTIILQKIGSNMVYSAIVLFAQFLGLSLVIDFFNSILHNNDD